MFLHVVLMAFNEQADAGFLRKVEAYCDRMRGECGGLMMYDFCVNAADRSGGLTHAIISGFVDEAAHDAYQVMPLHLEMKAFMAGCIERLTVFDGAPAHFGRALSGAAP